MTHICAADYRKDSSPEAMTHIFATDYGKDSGP